MKQKQTQSNYSKLVYYGTHKLSFHSTSCDSCASQDIKTGIRSVLVSKEAE